ncbi:MAG: chorismate-binding protein, partial [Bacteroidota bacterium]
MQKRDDSQDMGIYVETDLDPVQALHNEVQRVFETDLYRKTAYRNVVRIHVRLNPVDPFQWLKQQRFEQRIFWKGRRRLMSIAGIGTADVIRGDRGGIKALSAHRKAFTSLGRSRYFGGIRFDAKRPTSREWESFGSYTFYLPRFELTTSGDSAHLVCNLVLPRDFAQKQSILDLIGQIQMPEHNLVGSVDLPESRMYSPERETWIKMLHRTLDVLSSDEQLEKVVMARKVSFAFPEEVDRLLLFKHLCAIKHNHFQFYFQPEANVAFMGASPERLYRRDGRYIESEAVAGTGRRDTSSGADLQLADALLGSEKDQREHAFVRESIIRSMKDLCNTMHIDAEASLLEL